MKIQTHFEEILARCYVISKEADDQLLESSHKKRALIAFMEIAKEFTAIKMKEINEEIK